MWTQEEIQILKDNYQSVSKDEIQNLLPEKSWQQIKGKASNLGVTKIRRIPWTEAENKILRESWHSLDAVAMTKLLRNRSANAIRDQARKLELDKKMSYKSWTEEETAELEEMYSISSQSELLDLFPDRTYSAIEHKALRLGLEREEWVKHAKGNYATYTYDKGYFEVIDTADKAYILGLWYADGWVSKTKAGHRVGISLKEEDGYLLEEIAERFEYTGSVTYRSDRPACSLVINSRHLFEQFERCGVVQRKSLVIEYPKWLPPELDSDFIRGYFDGDGSVSLMTRNRIKMGFVSGSEQFLIAAKDIINWHCELEKGTIGLKEGNTHYLTYYSKADVEKIKEWMYDSVYQSWSELYLLRKLSKFEKYYG